MTKRKGSWLTRVIGSVISAVILIYSGAASNTFAADPLEPAFGSGNYEFNNSFSGINTIRDTEMEFTVGELATGDTVFVGGTPFGVKLFCDGLLIIGFDDVDATSGSVSPAKDAGIQKSDIIISANGKKVTSAEDFINVIEESAGAAVRLTCLRGDKVFDCEVTPSVSSADGKYKTGMWLRDSTAGIGTVTFVVPESGIFGGLGHGICDSETGSLVPLSRGITSGVVINSIERGEAGSPGELRGSFFGERTGSLMKNTDNGVFGIFTDKSLSGTEKVILGGRDDIKEGAAKIRCTLDGKGPKEYTINISDIHRDSRGNKNFIVTVTDKTLIEKTGGIVQGMSGSPIIQNGKLVGAVTHVLIGDPCKGYGIFIDNMIDAAR